MGAIALEKMLDPHYDEMISYLLAEGGYWLKNDKWNADSAEYKSLNLGPLKDGCHIIADFSGYKNGTIKTEVKYSVLLMLKERTIGACDLNNVYSTTIKLIGKTLGSDPGLVTLAAAGSEMSENDPADSSTAKREIYMHEETPHKDSNRTL